MRAPRREITNVCTFGQCIAAGSEGPTVELGERSISVFAHERGIGKSFGAPAIEVLDEVLGSRP